jgi:hypothetical protein
MLASTEKIYHHTLSIRSGRSSMSELRYETEDMTPVYFSHYTPDAIVVDTDSPFKSVDAIGRGK